MRTEGEVGVQQEPEDSRGFYSEESLIRTCGGSQDWWVCRTGVNCNGNYSARRLSSRSGMGEFPGSPQQTGRVATPVFSLSGRAARLGGRSGLVLMASLLL